MRKQKKYTRHVLEAVGAYKKTLDDHRFVGDCAYKISRQYGITRNTLQVVFKELYGVNIRQYKLQLRMDRGRDLLKSGMQVKRVSILLHYSTARAFVTAFKKQFGISPGRFSGARRA
jgi:AraC-like DNA-binding protein